MRKILFVIGSLQVGGAETVMVDIINNIYNKFDITVLLVTKKGELINRLNKNIKVKYLTIGEEYCTNIFSKIYNKIKRSLIYRTLGKNKKYVSKIYNNMLKEEFATEVAFLPGLPAEIVKRSPNKNSNKIAWIHSEAERSYNTDFLTICDGFDKIVGNCMDSIKAFKKYFPKCNTEIVLIYNYIDVSKIISLSEEKADFKYNKETINFISVGRLVEVKGFDRILDISKEFDKNVTFYIVGAGPLEEEYKKRIHNENIKNVKLIGLKTNPYPYIKNADVFLLTSHSEAFPTVVVEAMILNKSIISTDVLGVNEILNNYDDKIIVEDDNQKITNAIHKYISTKSKSDNCEKSNSSFIDRNNKQLEKIIAILGSDQNEKQKN